MGVISLSVAHWEKWRGFKSEYYFDILKSEQASS